MFTRYGHYAGEVDDIIIGRLAFVSYIAVPKIRAFSCGFDDTMLKSSFFYGHIIVGIKVVKLLVKQYFRVVLNSYHWFYLNIRHSAKYLSLYLLTLVTVMK